MLVVSTARADDFGRALVARAQELIEQAGEPKPVPRVAPTPVPVKWKAKRLGAVDLGSPLLTMTAGDLDGDGRAEIVAVTEDEVEILAPEGRRALAVVARVRLPGDAPSQEPRDAVATAVVVGRELRVRASTSGRGARYTYASGKLKEAGSLGDGYPLCSDRVGALSTGRDYFERSSGDSLPTDWPSRYWSAACADAVDPVGRAMRVDAVVSSSGDLTASVHVTCASGEADCTADRTTSLGNAGVALAVADIDHDGRAELVTSAAGAPGDADVVTVHTIPTSGGKLGKPIFKRSFSGGVGGLVAADVDGDGDTEVIAAVRLAGAERVDLWLLD